MDVPSLFATAQHEGRVGVARKSKLIDARPAIPGEIVISIIAGEGEETRSKPAEVGDMVVQNRCEATGHEEYLVKAGSFAERYEGPLEAERADGWRPYRPRGVDMLYFIVREADGNFTFNAPWGEPMIARPGDAIVRDPNDPNDTYRVARDAFSCTYEIRREPEAAKKPL
ncbi:hypothetical protein MPEAHAMD_4162 [Methylobacterium frigidaeris]|uniref:Uncharacterized protein n=2 Tax=Methylobacterium frigidaeris TaxID=2038277 RepID=A0AA37HDY6_9HYPH|nr:hypothetical protein MPEAHAMD_4162 [Methylobacterium frigidaeris]